MQVQFSLLSLGDDQMEIKEICDSLGIRLITYSPLGLGMITGKYTPSKLPSGPRALLFSQILPGLQPLLSSLQEIAQRRNKSIPQGALSDSNNVESVTDNLVETKSRNIERGQLREEIDLNALLKPEPIIVSQNEVARLNFRVMVAV